ncbi:MAG: hypothetical protein ACXWUH_18750 [Burkholderiales bacterium]
MTTQSSESESLSHVPAYIGERSRDANNAGLILEKQTRRQGMLSSWYVGSEAQFRGARLLRVPPDFVFPARVGGRKLYSLCVFSPAAAHAELKCTVVRIDGDRYRLAIVNEVMPVSWRSLGSRIDVYKYCDLKEGGNSGPATVYVGPFSALHAAGIAPAEAERETHCELGEQHPYPWQSQPLGNGRCRFVVHHEAEAKARARDEERGRSNFKNPEQYQEWLLEVAAASIGMIRRQLRMKTKRRYIYTVPARTIKELETHFARLRKTLARAEILVEKEDVRAEEQRARLRDAQLAAMRDADFQRFLGRAITPLPGRKR